MDSGSLPINGGRTQWTGEHLYPYDFITLTPKTPRGIYEKCAPLYEKGLSLRDIETRTGIAKSTIRKALNNNGMSLRNPLADNAGHKDRLHTKRGGGVPYGWAFLDGELVIDPKQQLVVRQIMKLHHEGKSFRAIVNHLNDKKVPTQMRGQWRGCTIKSIITRQKELSKNGGST